MPRTTAPRLVARPRDHEADVALDDSQRAALAAAAGPGATLVVGAPGTGKTLVAQEVVLAALADGLAPERVLLLASSRRAAASLRDRLSARARRTVGAPMVRTAASAAFAVLRERAAALGEPVPTLISGPEQDLVLSELLEGHLEGDLAHLGSPLVLPPGLPEEALGLRGLRQELRDLLMRAAERGLTPADLAALGDRYERPEWSLGAQLFAEYLDVTALRSGTPDAGARFDPAIVVDEAAEALLAWDDEVPDAARPRWDLVVVDDYQEATVATARLLHVLHDDGARLVLLGDPDSAVQTFRGASPGLVGRASAPARRDGARRGELGARVAVLGTAWRQDAALRDVTRRVAAQVGTVAGAVHRGAAPRHAHVAEVAVGDAAADGAPRQVDAPQGAGSGGDAGAATPPVQVAVLSAVAQEAAFVARELRAEHLLHGTPWHRMAVVARTGTRLAALRRELVAASVPVTLLGSDVPLRDEPAVAPLLAAVRVCVADPDDAEALDPFTAAALLTSPVGALDVVALRRLRRALRAEELEGGGGRSSDALLVELLQDPARAATLPPTVRRGPVAVARALAAGRTAAAEPGATAQTVLWAVWAATGLAERWRSAALDGGPAGARADRDLDAVLALFRAAETFVDRMPGAPAEAFVEYLASQDLPADSLAASASGADAVAALTPAGAAGREWDVVVVAGVQDGVWPDLRLRDSLLGSQALVELLAGRAHDAHGVGSQARAQVLADELRAFVVATSRATRRLVVTAVQDAEEAPSVFCDLVVPPAAPEGPDAGPDGPDDGSPQPAAGGGTSAAPAPGADPDARRHVRVGAPLDLRGLVAAARGVLVEAAAREARASTGASGESSDRVAPGADRGNARADDGVRDARAVAAATLLADLGELGVAEARPETWYGVAGVSSTASLRGAEEMVTVSPSKVETVSTCPLRWSLEAAGGTAPDATHQSLGTLVHSIAESHPSGSLAELRAELDRRWAELALPEGWPTRQLRRRADRMIEKLAAYVAQAGEPLLVEPTFDVTVGRARLRGTIDRVEDAGEGKVRVVDLKTGRRTATKAEGAEHPQLGAYQLAVEAGALDVPEGTRSAGAQLVYVGSTHVGPAVVPQPALDPAPDGSSWARDLVEEAAGTMSAATFTARQNGLCEMCPVRRACPVQPEGRRVVA
ncbi:superfamily I DNA/RNA helicase/RecB family exonuclease [Cellulosimicrobium cellulans]|uniref:ATP-dependent helicase n=1 Tax=Cellulosimicrobium cellulans TaxID=1710 RepID=UPI0027DD7E47|nr:PD-(D/E)XK nuclease family protein [Cellulosimicrobium cellulans]MBM7819111.1 superfamily I DNA/RNA helicase/RecB family exonuclease [Cellulosimicrobium cellulans]